MTRIISAFVAISAAYLVSMTPASAQCTAGAKQCCCGLTWNQAKCACVSS